VDVHFHNAMVTYQTVVNLSSFDIVAHSGEWKLTVDNFNLEKLSLSGVAQSINDKAHCYLVARLSFSKLKLTTVSFYSPECTTAQSPNIQLLYSH